MQNRNTKKNEIRDNFGFNQLDDEEAKGGGGIENVQK